ncbi:MAG: hypothetical protein JST82_15985 [Bacteroidetes bacterium]|nr:hypothetical protein [Bacteroidota bacterium]
MGGSSSTPFTDGSRSIDCEDLDIKTQLSSPVASVIAILKVGDILEIEFKTPTGPCLAIFKGVLAGTIINKDVRRIIECIVSGHKFVARVRNITGGRCAITIKHASAI